VDAAVATAFAMTVVEPFMSCLAGGGSLLIHRPRDGGSAAIDFNVEAPARAHSRLYRLRDGKSGDLFPWRLVEGDANIHGPLAVAVPGSVAGLALALERWGTMDLRDVVAPAARLARRGVAIDWYQALVTATYAEELARFPEAARVYLRDGRYPPRPAHLAAGDRWRQPDLARSLELIGKEGPDVLYRGELGQAVVAELARLGGILTAADLAAYRVRVEAPLQATYRGATLLGMPGATGCVTAVEALNILATFDLAGSGPADPTTLHLRAEAIGQAFRDRLRYLGDPRDVRAPWAGLVAPAYAARVAANIGPAGPRIRSGPADPWRFQGAGGRGSRTVRGARRPGGGGTRGPAAGECTTHVCAVDADRTLVSLTHTAVGLFGSKVVVPGTGLLLSNGMIWFDPEPGHPNSIAPGRRALVNMTPFLALRAGAPWMAVGAPGGRKIISAVTQVLSNLLDLDLSPQAAVDAPRLHTEGETLEVDERVVPRVVAALRRLGHRVTPLTEDPGTFHFARPQVIAVAADGLRVGLDALRPTTSSGV
jgi:gamma-glutamyltranspeptidase/glutathione hydrolase